MFDKYVPDIGKITYKAYPVVLLRLFAGFWMLFAGVEKLLEPGWSSAGFLKFATAGSPLHGWFAGLAGNTVVDGLVVYGEIIIGLTLVLGLLVRLAAYSGILMNGLFWVATYPWEHGPFESNSALIAMYITFIFIGAGITLGLDGYIQKTKTVEQNSWIKVFLG